MYEGHIYNKEGSPLEGIKVSDGRNVAVTDSAGYYSLPGWERESLIFVQALTRRHSDWYQRIENDVTSYDFHIDLYEGGRDSTFLHISDTEIFIGGASADDWLPFINRCIGTENPDFLIHTGDICRKAGLEAHYKALCSETAGIPVRRLWGCLSRCRTSSCTLAWSFPSRRERHAMRLRRHSCRGAVLCIWQDVGSGVHGVSVRID